MTNIVWTQSALQTLELVYLQTLQYTKNERIAAKLHNKLIKEAEMLRTFPNAGNILNTSERVTLCYRALVVDTNYKLIYYVDANKDVIIVTVWKSLGYAMIFYLSALEKVPKELYEASGLDGAKGWQRFRDVTIPCISPTTFFLVIITMVTSLQAYDQIQILTQGGPSGSTRTLLYMYYQLGFQEFNMGQATAVAVIMVIITVLLSAVQFTASKKWVHY